MANYNFKKFFDINKIHNEEYVSNGHFVIKRTTLTKAQNNFVNTFQNDSRIESIMKTFHSFVNDEYKYNTSEFIPELIVMINGTDEDYQTVIDKDHYAIKEEYYNFIKSLKCRIFKVEKELMKPAFIYNEDNILIGIIVPVRVQPSDVEKATSYNEYIELQKGQEEQKEQKKQNQKKCLYISDNKAIVRNKKLTCVAELVNDEVYKNLYVESDYKKDGGMVFIDFGFILMYITNLSKYDDNPETIKYRLEDSTDHTFDNYKAYIDICLTNNQFINVAEIKLMELAGESSEYIHTLTDHRQKVLDLREQKHKEEEQKRERENQEYVTEKNKIAEDMISNAEHLITNKETVQNKDITVYKSRYNSNTSKLILHLMKKYDINIPLKTQGWINQALANIFYDESDNSYSYQYYKSSKDSTTFSKYLDMLVSKINAKYDIMAVVR